MCHHAHPSHEQAISAMDQASLLPLLVILIEATPRALQTRN